MNGRARGLSAREPNAEVAGSRNRVFEIHLP